MCIIAAKPAGVKMPGAEQIQIMWHNNPDGAGIMYVSEGKVHIDKGFMKLSEVLKHIQNLGKSVDLDECPVVLHFRMASAGGVKPENCHPFPVTTSERVIRQLHCTTALGMVHNGTLQGYGNSQLSDSMQYMIMQVAPMARAVPDFWHNRYCLEMIANATRGSWIVLLAEDGTLVTIGDFFIEHEGIYYSNKGYTAKPSLIDIYDNGRHVTGNELEGDRGNLKLREKKALNIVQNPDGDAHTVYFLDQQRKLYRWDDELDAAVPIADTRIEYGESAFNVDSAYMTEIFG